MAMHLTRDRFGAWLARYLAAWRSYDPVAIGDLFGPDAVYSRRAGRQVVNGREAIVAWWLAEQDPPGSWAAHYEPLAIDDQVHVASGWTRYVEPDGSVREEYSNIFVCRFDAAGRCSEITEWWMDMTGWADGEAGRPDRDDAPGAADAPEAADAAGAADAGRA
jgi:hypothetical protein